MSLTTNQTRFLYFGVAAVAVGIVAYNVWGTDTPIASTISSKAKDTSSSLKASAPKPDAYTPSGDAQTWSEADMKRYLSERNMAVGHNPTKQELLAMVLSKLHEPTATGFDDPTEWSVEDMRAYLKDNKMEVSHSTSRMELLAMVESKMHEPKV